MNARLIKHLDTIDQTDPHVLQDKYPKHLIKRARLYLLAAYSVPLAAFVVTFYGLIVLFVDIFRAYPQAQTRISLPPPLYVGIVFVYVGLLVVVQAKRHGASMLDNALADILDSESDSPFAS